MCVHATWTQKLHRATICSPKTAGAAVIAALTRRARHRAHRRRVHRLRCPRHRIHRPHCLSCARTPELFLEEGVRLLQLVEAATPPSRTTFQLILQAHRRWRRGLPTDARASAAPSLVTTAEDFVAAAFIIHQRCPFRHRLHSHPRRRHQSASWDAMRVATIGTRSTLTRFHSRNTAAAAGAPSSSKTFASRVALTAPAIRHPHRHRRCHHHPARHRPRRQVHRRRHPRPCRPLPFAPMISPSVSI